ncbi:MAG: hypothetical protein R2752_21035 [Vicinamibacterales bacterium]
MLRRHLRSGLAATAAFVLMFAALPAGQTTSLGQVRLPRAVVANGGTLTAGTYAVRVTSDAVPPVVGQTPSESRWVEFLQGGQVKGKELATVLTAAELSQISESARPAAGTAKVELLKGNDYVRVWINHGGTNYLVHLAVAGQ